MCFEDFMDQFSSVLVLKANEPSQKLSIRTDFIRDIADTNGGFISKHFYLLSVP